MSLLLLLLLGCSNTQGELEQTSDQDFILIPQTGNSYSDGFLHGKTCKSAIKLQVASWSQSMQSELGFNQDSFHNIIHSKTGFLSAIKANCPDLLEEINGIADGAGVNRELILPINLGEEIYSYAQRPIEHCSSLAVETPVGNVLTYNQDLPSFLHGNTQPVILQYPDAFVFAMPGTIGISGVSKTAAISCNSLPMLRMDEEGLPLSFALRQMLTLSSDASVKDYIRNTPLAIPQNLLLATAVGVVGFEISKGEAIEYLPDTSVFLFHTNFPIRSGNFKNNSGEIKACKRYEAISLLTQKTNVKEEHIPTTLMEGFGLAPLTNRETYLRFTITFSSSLEYPEIQFINPRRSGVIHSLPF